MDLDGLELLRRIKRENLCATLSLTSDFRDFSMRSRESERAYLIICFVPDRRDAAKKPFSASEKAVGENRAAQQQACDTLVQHMGTEQLSACFDALVQEYTQQIPDAVQTDIFIQHLYESTVEKTFEIWTWLALFEIGKRNICRLTGCLAVSIWFGIFCRRRLCALSAAIATLYLANRNEKATQNPAVHLLQHIDDGCLQKDVAAAHYISNPSLSELFRSQLGMTYHAYTSELKLKRAQYLLLIFF